MKPSPAGGIGIYSTILPSGEGIGLKYATGAGSGNNPVRSGRLEGWERLRYNLATEKPPDRNRTLSPPEIAIPMDKQIGNSPRRSPATDVAVETRPPLLRS